MTLLYFMILWCVSGLILFGLLKLRHLHRSPITKTAIEEPVNHKLVPDPWPDPPIGRTDEAK